MNPAQQYREMRAAAENVPAGVLGEAGASGGHRPYFNAVLEDEFCHACGAPWPCLPYRDTVTCRCAHSASLHDHGTGECWSTACGCQRFRLRGESS